MQTINVDVNHEGPPTCRDVMHRYLYDVCSNVIMLMAILFLD